MNILQSFKMAMKSIMGNKMRSFLTMLGIIIGVASVIILVSLVNGQMSYMTESFASMGTNQITVNVTNLSTRSVSVDEMYEFYEDNRDLFAQMTPNVTVSTTVKNGTESSTSTTVSGVSEEYLDMKDMELESGRFIQYSDIVSRQKVCVVGYYVAWDLYGGVEKAIDQTIKIGGNAFRIIGVAARQDDDELESGGSDDFVWMPYSCAAKMTRNANISSYTFATADMNHTEEAKTAIDDFLMEIFKDDDLYRITAMSELLDSLNSMIAMMSMLLGGIAGISLLVAGVGVMNIMLVSVTERTREIGIRKAIGAERKSIVVQFLIEAAMICGIGGIFGIGVGYIGTLIVGKLSFGTILIPSAAITVAAAAISVALGIIFGMYPAIKASGLQPVVALRAE